MSIPSATLPPPPRRVRSRRIGSAFGIWALRLFLLPHSCVGVAMPVVACAMLAWALFGSPLPGTITGGHPATTGKHGSSATINFSYESDGPRTGSDKVDDATYARLIQNGKPEEELQRVSVRHLKIGPFHIAGVDALESPWSSVGFFFVFSAFWDLILTPFVYLIWLRPLLQRRLCKIGLETPGTITALDKITGNKSSRFVVKYTYTDPTGTPRTGKMDTSSDQWNAATQGQPTLVLFSPKNFKRSVAYDFCPYKILDDNRPSSNPYALKS